MPQNNKNYQISRIFGEANFQKNISPKYMSAGRQFYQLSNAFYFIKNYVYFLSYCIITDTIYEL